MVVGIFGESCTGKSTIAGQLAERANARVYTGRDYLKLAKNEAEAVKAFADMLKAGEASAELIVFVISEKEHLPMLPERAVRVLTTAPLDTIKERFAGRMNGNLPAPVAAMLERKHGMFDNEKHDLRADGESVSAVCDEIIGLCEA